MRYEVVLSSQARRALAEGLPEAVAAAVFAFLSGPLRTDPYRVGKPLVGTLAGLRSARRGEYRVIYRIDGHRLLVDVVTIAHRRDAYRR